MLRNRLILLCIIFLGVSAAVGFVAAQSYTFGDNDPGYVLGTATGAGTALVNLFNGTGQGFTGGSQTQGGVDDYNNAGAAPGDRYVGPAGWTQCAAGNNYCGLGSSFSGSVDAKDNSTGLIWSLPCNGVRCASFSDASPLTYSWDDSRVNNGGPGGLTASQLCSGGDHGQTGWSLPHQKQLMQAYIDGSYGNLEDAGVFRDYWSATTYSASTGNALVSVLSYDYTLRIVKGGISSVRCVRL